MGLVRADIALRNVQSMGAKMKVSALVDTGAVHLCIPKKISDRLELDHFEERTVTTADGRKQEVPYVGPIQVSFGNRSCLTGALVLGDEVLLGAIPMEDMDLVIHPTSQSVTVNPESPDIPASIAMGLPK